MTRKDKIHTKYRYKNITAICSECFYPMEIGDISADITIKFAPATEIKCVDINPYYLLKNDDEITSPTISITCPKCGNECFIVDTKIADTIVFANIYGFKTISSCSGKHNHSNAPYIMFEKESYDILKKYYNDTENLKTEEWYGQLEFNQNTIYSKFSDDTKKFCEYVIAFLDYVKEHIDAEVPESLTIIT